MSGAGEHGGLQSALSATFHGNMLRLARPTIRMRVVAIVLTLAIPLNIVVAVVIWRLASAANEAQRTSLLYAARSVATALDTDLAKYIALAQMLSRHPALHADSLDGFEGELREHLAGIPDTCALVADPDGRQLLNTQTPHGQSLPLQPDGALEAQRRAFETGRVVISDIYQASAPPSTNWIVSVNIAVFKDGAPWRALALTVYARRFFDLLAVQDMPTNWDVAIRDSKGRFVARALDQDLWVGRLASDNFQAIRNQTGLFQITSRHGEDFLVANMRSDLSGWTIGTGIKTSDLRLSVFNAIAWSVALGAAISLLSLVFAISIARRITGPLAELRQRAEAVLADPEISFEPGVPELRELWAALQQAAANRYRSEAMARSTEKRLSQIINTYNGYVGLLDKNGRITEANVQMLKAIGAPREAVIGQAFADVNLWAYSSAARQEMVELIARSLNGETVRQDMQYCHGGEIGWIAFQATPLRSADGTIEGLVPSGYDITDRKHAEKALHQSEKRFRNLYEHALAGITLSDWEGRFCACNPAFCNLVGYSEDELRGIHFGQLIHPDDRDDNVRRVRGLRTGEVKALTFENRFLHKNGTPVWVQKIISRLPAQAGQPGQFFMVCIDTSPRKQKEEELRQSEARLQLALEADGAGMWENLVDSDEFIASEPALNLHGLPPGTPMTRENLLASLHPDDRSKVEQAWRDTLETGAPYRVEIRCPLPDGTMRWLHSQGQLHEIGGQRRLIGLVRDISRRKAAETAVRTSNMRLELALDAARLGWWLYDPIQLKVSWDSRFKEIVGITEPHAEVTAVLARLLAEDSNRICDAAAAALDPLDPKPLVGEFRIARGNGETRWIEIYGRASFEGTGAARSAAVMVGTVADITERKRAEEQQQLSMRELSHRTKNLLSVVQSIANQTAASSPSGFVERFSQRIRALSASLDLLVHSEWRGVEIEALVRAQLAHFADLIGDRIMIDGPPLVVTPSAAQSIGMALHELATNAGKYGSLSSDQGSVTVEWRLADDEFCIAWIEQDGPRVKPPKRRGFGSTIISTVAEHSLAGEVELDYAASGVVWRLKCSARKALNPPT